MTKAIAIEKWAPVVGYEGLYEVSNSGKVRSLFRYKKELKPCLTTNGYFYVQLFKNKKGTNHYLHRLVAKAFIDNPLGKELVNHKDEIKTNNSADNLEWVTHVENCNYGTAIARRTQHFDYSKRRINNAQQITACSKPIAQYTKDGRLVCNWKSASECARENGWTVSCIRRNCLGERATAYGFVFKEVAV